MGLIRLVYTSESRLVEANRREELVRILESAHRLNAGNGVTGFLLATTTAFAQILEGEHVHVAETYGRIEADPRHRALRLLLQEPLAERSFTGWAMGMAERDQTTNFIFGLYGVTPESDLPEQPADALLDLAGELSRQIA